MKKETKFKQTEIGMIPEDWEVDQLDKFLEWITYGFTCPMPTTSSGPYMITAKDLEGNMINYDIARKTDEISFNEKLTDKSRPKFNDLLLSKDGTLGRVAIVKNERICINQSVALLRPNKNIFPEFLFYLLISPLYQKKMELDSDGTVIKHIYITRVNKMKVAIPPLPEQASIVKILFNLDSKIELIQTQNKTLEAIGQALFKHWFVDFEFPNEEGKPYKSSGGEMVHNEELGKEIPKGWEISNILESADLLSGGTPKTEIMEYWGGDISWVSAKDVTDAHGSYIIDTERKITQAGVDNSNAKLLPKNTTIVTARGTIGSYCILSKEMSMNQTNYGLKAKSDSGDFYIFFTISNLVSQMKQSAYGTIFDTITTKTFNEMKIPIPTKHTIKIFESKIVSIMNKMLSNIQETKNLTSLRDSLLPKLMSGKIRVPVEVK